MFQKPMHRQVLLLSSAQALFQTASVLVMTVGGLAGSQITPEPQLATAPIASMFLGTALTTVPASLWMARAGRRTGFVAGAALGVLGGLVAAFGIFVGSLLLLCLGTLLIGAYQGFAQFYRFAATEVSDRRFAPRLFRSCSPAASSPRFWGLRSVGSAVRCWCRNIPAPFCSSPRFR